MADADLSLLPGTGCTIDSTDTSALQSDWGSAVDSSGGGGLGDLLRCVKGGTVQLRDLCR